jgi:hypothetical protein
MKNSDDTIGNRTRDLPGCSTVPQPTGPRGPLIYTAQFRNSNRHRHRHLFGLAKPTRWHTNGVFSRSRAYAVSCTYRKLDYMETEIPDL